MARLLKRGEILAVGATNVKAPGLGSPRRCLDDEIVLLKRGEQVVKLGRPLELVQGLVRPGIQFCEAGNAIVSSNRRLERARVNRFGSEVRDERLLDRNEVRKLDLDVLAILEDLPERERITRYRNLRRNDAYRDGPAA